MKTNNPFEIIKDRAVLFDGAMGTMLDKYGIEPGELPETWNLGHPEVIRSIHEAYLDAGADVITANTFGCSPLKYDGETLGKLVAAGLVERRQSVRDKRIFNIFLTDEGRERLSELIEDRPDFAALFLSPLCDEEKQRLLELLGKLIGAAGPDSDERGEDYDEE